MAAYWTKTMVSNLRPYDVIKADNGDEIIIRRTGLESPYHVIESTNIWTGRLRRDRYLFASDMVYIRVQS